MDDLLVRRVRPGLGGELADVRINDGRITAITEPDSSREFAARVVDGHGGTLLPGLVDAHVHLVQWATHRRRIPLDAARSAAEAVELLLAHLLATPSQPEELVVGAGFRDGLWPDKPDKDLLQRALPGRAVALFSADLHTLWLSPAALRLIGRDHPTGILLENDCMAATAALPSAPIDVQDQWVADAIAAAAARGVTGIADYEYADTVADWTRRSAETPPSARISCVIARHLLDLTIERGHHTGDVLPGADGRLTVGPFKLFTDGSLNTRTAYCHEPYPGTDSLGRLELPPSELVSLMRRAVSHGLVPAVHAIGDQANTIALDAFAELRCPGRIEHAQLLRTSDIPRFAQLGVIAGIQPAHQPDDRDVADRHWSDRTARAFPYRSLLDSGARLEIGSDAPVSPLDPWDGIASAISRTDDDRPPWHPEQSIPFPEALAAASGGRRGIAVGDVADLMIVGADPSTLSPSDLRALPVTVTILGGHITHLV